MDVGDHAAEAGHVPVMLGRVLELLAPAVAAARDAGRAPRYLDATLGMGGHAEAMLRAHPDLRLIGLDRDTTALERSARRLAPTMRAPNKPKVRYPNAYCHHLGRPSSTKARSHSVRHVADSRVAAPQRTQ